MPADWIQPYSCVLVDVNIEAYKSSHWFLTLLILDEMSVWSVGWISYPAWIVLPLGPDCPVQGVSQLDLIDYPHRRVQRLGGSNVVRPHFPQRLHGLGRLSLNRFCQARPLREGICGLWGDQTFEDEVKTRPMSYVCAQRGQQKTDTKMRTCEVHKYAQMRAYLILDTVLQSTHFQPLLLLLLAEEKMHCGIHSRKHTW